MGYWPTLGDRGCVIRNGYHLKGVLRRTLNGDLSRDVVFDFCRPFSLYIFEGKIRR